MTRKTLIYFAFIFLLASPSIASSQDEKLFDLMRSDSDVKTKVEKINAAISAGAEVNTTDDQGESPLLFAVQSNQKPAVIKTLLDAGANPNFKNESQSILMAAIETTSESKRSSSLASIRSAIYGLVERTSKENITVLKDLIDAGANVNFKNEWDETPLMIAAEESDNSKVINILLEAGADVTAEDYRGRTAVRRAAIESDNPAILRNLVSASGYSKSKQKIKNDTLRTAATTNENPSIIEGLIKIGADPNTKDDSQKTPLHLAADNNENPKIIKTLIDAGANVNARNHYGGTPLMGAVFRENSDALKMLLDAGANVHAKNSNGVTALMLASKDAKNTGNVRLLMEAGAIVKAQSYDGMTPLMYASKNNSDTEIFQMLLNAGARVNASDERGKTPILWAGWAAHNKNTENNLEVIKTLLQAEANPSPFQNSDKRNLLDYAKEQENLPTEKVKKLIAEYA